MSRAINGAALQCLDEQTAALASHKSKTNTNKQRRMSDRQQRVLLLNNVSAIESGLSIRST